jgi:hypothetical protein
MFKEGFAIEHKLAITSRDPLTVEEKGLRESTLLEPTLMEP